MASAVLDGEAVAGDGHEGIQAVFAERNRAEGDAALVAFDVLELGDKSMMREPWAHRRKRLEDLFSSVNLPRVGIVPVTDDAPSLYETWVGWGGEGIGPSRTGCRSTGPACARPPGSSSNRSSCWTCL